MKSIQMLLVLGLIFVVPFSNAEKIDWNDKKIQWMSYGEGIQKLEAEQSLGLILLYADWCSTCKAYSKLFKRENVIRALADIPVMRANVDEVEAVEYLASVDKKYVPKTIVINGRGEFEGAFHDKNKDFMFFLPTSNEGALLKLIKQVRKANLEQSKTKLKSQEE